MLLLRVRRFAHRHEMWRGTTRVIAAVSGGSDSVALALLLKDLDAAGELVLDAVAHLNHQIRGREADEDEKFCEALAARLGVHFVSDQIDVPARAAIAHESLEVAARHARREFLERVRIDRAADCMATAHTADDQAETVLLRIVRGTGLRGLSGIAPVRGHIIRPLLECTRQDVTTELRVRGQTWREDTTNNDVEIPRNRVRHELLPYLERHFNPMTRAALLRLADVARADHAFLDRDAAAACFGLLRVDDTETRIDAAALNALPESLARRVVLEALEVLRRGGSLDDVDAVREVAAEARAAADISGLRVEHSEGFVVLTHRGESSLAPMRSLWFAPFRFDLPVPGQVHMPGAGWSLEARGPVVHHPGATVLRAHQEVEIDATVAGRELVVRSRQPGDRLRPLGLGGEKKLQDIFVDRKVDRDERDGVPIVTDKSGRIVWIAGHVLAEDFRVTDRTRAVVVLKLRRI